VVIPGARFSGRSGVRFFGTDTPQLTGNLQIPVDNTTYRLSLAVLVFEDVEEWTLSVPDSAAVARRSMRIARARESPPECASVTISASAAVRRFTSARKS
jgi:hypothetical protein